LWGVGNGSFLPLTKLNRNFLELQLQIRDSAKSRNRQSGAPSANVFQKTTPAARAAITDRRPPEKRLVPSLFVLHDLEDDTSIDRVSGVASAQLPSTMPVHRARD
jgi:hypothetical protein